MDDIWTAYQDSRFGYVVMRLNQVLPMAYVAARQTAGAAAASGALANLYHVAASVMVKVGDLDLARLCADRGDIEARRFGEPITLMSLQRSIVYTLLSNGRFGETVAVVRDGAIEAADHDSRAGDRRGNISTRFAASGEFPEPAATSPIADRGSRHPQVGG